MNFGEKRYLENGQFDSFKEHKRITFRLHLLAVDDEDGRQIEWAYDCDCPTFQSVYGCQATCSVCQGTDGHMCGGGQWCIQHISGSRTEWTGGA